MGQKELNGEASHHIMALPVMANSNPGRVRIRNVP
jgi:hypothetical protein